MRRIFRVRARSLGAVAALTVVGAAFTTGVSVGSIPAGDGTFSGCYGQRTEVVSLPPQYEFWIPATGRAGTPGRSPTRAPTPSRCRVRPLAP